MREHLGEEYGGTVSAATSFGLFVTLDELHVEGLVHISELGGEYYKFDEARQELRGERTGMRYAAGSRLRVQVSRVDLDGRKIDFRLVQDSAAAVRPAKDRVQTSAAELAEVKSEDRVQRQATKKAASKSLRTTPRKTPKASKTAGEATARKAKRRR